MSEFCPRCGTARLGAFRFCRHCRFDFEAPDAGAATVSSFPSPSGVEPATPPRAPISVVGRSRLTSRRLAGTGAVAAVAVILIASLTSGARPTASTGDPASEEVAAGALRTPTPAVPASTPWATVKPSLAPTGPTVKAKVVRIVDGDTIVVALGGKNVKVRYIGMDTPEDVDPNSPVEPMSREAAAANQSLVGGKTVVLEKDVSETDQYGRLLRYVWLSSGSGWTLVNLELVRRGLASAATYPPDVKYVDLFTSTETTARAGLVGLWAPDATFEPPATPEPTPRATPRPTPRPTPKPTKKPSSCHPSYTPCLPIVDDLDCPDVRAMGKAPVHVIGPDDYRLDSDHDGLGCE